MSFDVAASAYDRFMGRYSVPLASAFADWVGVTADARALDVGCGPGALTELLAARLGPGAVVGVDPSTSFVAAARERMPEVDIRLAAAEDLPFDDASFDLCLAELVVHFMADAAAGVAEMVRVTRPGGTVAVCVWDFAGGRAPQTAFFRALTEVAPDTEDETGRVGAHQGDLAVLLDGAGCGGVVESELTVRVDYASFDEWWGPYTLGVAPAGRQLALLDDAAKDEVRRIALERMGEGPFTVEATAWAARGTA